MQRRPGASFLVVFGLALIMRVTLLFTFSANLRHDSAACFGSAALGFVHGQGLTTSVVEIKRLNGLRDNVSGDYYALHSDGDRQPQTEFLPGPAFLLGILWKITGVHNYAPYLLLQVILESLLIATASVLIVRRHDLLGIATTAFLIIDLVAIKRTLMMGYDFWPQFGVLVYFAGTLWLIGGHRKLGGYFVVGGMLAVAVWFREITTFLPFAASPFLLLYLIRRQGLPRCAALVRISLLLLPVVLSISLLSSYRLDTTGNVRPTRSTFWHTFFAGVGQFSNPYGVESNDLSVWELGKRLDPSLANKSLYEMYYLPNSPYESALRTEAKRFVMQHPWLFFRNAIYRVAIMVSPLLYRTGDYLPPRLGRLLWPIGVLLIPLWGIGIVELWRRDRLLFAVMAGIYVYFFVAFGWFYVVGRVILPFLFLNVLAYMAGIGRLAQIHPLRGGGRQALT